MSNIIMLLISTTFETAAALHTAEHTVVACGIT